jgi:hypothetical protein
MVVGFTDPESWVANFHRGWSTLDTVVVEDLIVATS